MILSAIGFLQCISKADGFSVHDPGMTRYGSPWGPEGNPQVRDHIWKRLFLRTAEAINCFHCVIHI